MPQPAPLIGMTEGGSSFETAAPFHVGPLDSYQSLLRLDSTLVPTQVSRRDGAQIHGEHDQRWVFEFDPAWTSSATTGQTRRQEDRSWRSGRTREGCRNGRPSIKRRLFG